MTTKNIEELVDLWAQRFKELGDKEHIKYVFIFENKGRIIGVTLDHPRGQLYALPFIPPIICKELSSSRKYMRRRGNCLFCTIIDNERKAASCSIHENRDFICFLSFFARSEGRMGFKGWRRHQSRAAIIPDQDSLQYDKIICEEIKIIVLPLSSLKLRAYVYTNKQAPR